MSKNALEEIRKRLQAADSKKQQSEGSSATFRFWDMPEGSTSRVRFLPDGNENNVFFWVEKKTIELPFPGVVGHDEQKEVTVHVPCMEMYGESCPVLTEVRPWWKDKDLEDMARKYWVKRKYLMQGFVVDSPVKEENAPENPIRVFALGSSLFNVIKAFLIDPEAETVPTDYDNGLDFFITKTKKGNWADYSTSKWARKETALTDDQLALIQDNGLFNLEDLLPKKPSDDHKQAIVEMFEASVNGDLYDPTRWGKYYRPYGLDVDSAQGTAEAKTPNKTAKKAPVDDDADADQDDNSDKIDFSSKEEKPAASTTKKSPHDILAKIKSRSQ